MKRLIALLFLACAVLSAQPGQQTQVQTTAADPTGDCRVQAVALISSNASQTVFKCNQTTGVWTAMPSGGINCGSSATCAAPTTTTAQLKIATGTVAFSSSTTATVSGLTGFTSATSFACMVSNANAHAYTSGVEVTAATGFTIVSGTSNSDTWIWVCMGT